MIVVECYSAIWNVQHHLSTRRLVMAAGTDRNICERCTRFRLIDLIHIDYGKCTINICGLVVLEYIKLLLLFYDLFALLMRSF